MNTKSKTNVILHGECMVFPSTLPSTAQRQVLNSKVLVVADSETTGNHHVVDVMEGVEVYRDGERIFIQNSVPTTIRCVLADRHDAIELSPGTYEFGTQQEYDPFTARLNKVRD